MPLVRSPYDSASRHMITSLPELSHLDESSAHHITPALIAAPEIARWGSVECPRARDDGSRQSRLSPLLQTFANGWSGSQPCSKGDYLCVIIAESVLIGCMEV